VTAPPPAEAAGLGSGVSGLMEDLTATVQLQQLISAGQHERAFALALGKNQIAILTWLCSKLEPKCLTGPPPMSQIILASLVQQLAIDLPTQSRLKLAWLRECLQLLKPHDPHIAPNVGRILAQLSEKLSEASDAVDDSSMADLSLLTFMVKKLSAA